jgi:hypothetical protein
MPSKIDGIPQLAGVLIFLLTRTHEPQKMASALNIATRLFAEGFAQGRQTPEGKTVAASLAAAGMSASCIFTETESQFQHGSLKTLTTADMAVGNPKFVRLALQQLGVPIPGPSDRRKQAAEGTSAAARSRSRVASKRRSVLRPPRAGVWYRGVRDCSGRCRSKKVQ